jgi:ribonuclease HI
MLVEPRESGVTARPIVVFTDGAAKGNPGPGGWGCGIVLPKGRVVERGGGVPHTTNNQMELTAAIRALEALRAAPEAVHLYTDSTYVVRGITEWIPGWRRRGWRTKEGGPVLNRELWEQLAHLAEQRRTGGAITWHHVAGHAGTPGNERADAIADAYARGEPIGLYDGPLRDYDVAVLDLPQRTAPPARRDGRAARKQPAYSYLSVVAGKPMRHATWADCERRVKGQSGARFKKATSAGDEASILRGWGFSPDDVG